MIPGLTLSRKRCSGAVALDQLDLLRARPDDRHLAAQHVDQLRQLVEAEPAQEAPDAGHAGVVGELEHRVAQVVEADHVLEPVLGVGDHGPELVHLERAAVEPGAGLVEEHGPAAVELDRDRDQGEERGREQEPDRGDDDVEAALDQRRRARRIPGLVLEHRQVGDPREAHRAGPPVQRRDHAQLHLALAAERDQAADLARLHPVGGEDHPVDAAGERVEGLDLVLVDEAQVHVGEEVELAADHLREVAVAEHRGDLGRRQPAPDPARARRAAPARRRRRPPRRPRPSPGMTSPAGVWGRISASIATPAAAQAAIAGQLVDGQVADRDVVAVVEPDQLREHDPDREQHQGPEGVGGRGGDDEAGCRGRDQVGEREHAAAQGVAPEARPSGVAIRALLLVDRRGRPSSCISQRVTPRRAKRTR